MKKTILLVEDEGIIAMSEKKALEQYGYAVKTATSGEKAIEIVESDSDLNLILMDIDLGNGLDGTQTAQIILEDHEIPIVFVSSHSEREVVEKTENITSYGYVVKSSSITVLDASIKMAFKLFDEKNENRLKKNQLVEKNQLMENILEHFPGCVFWKDANSVYLGCNSAEASAAGFATPAEIVGKSDFELRWTDHSAEFYRNTDRIVMESGKPKYHIEYSYREKNGNLVWADTCKVPLIDKEGKVTGVFGMAVDITERKKAEDALRESESKYRLMFENTGTSMILIEDNMVISMANAEFYQKSGYTKEDLARGVKWSEMVHPDDLAFMIERHKTRRENNSNIPRGYEYRFRRKTGEYRDALLSIELIPGTRQSIASIIDITAQKNIERKLSESEEKYRLLVENSHDIIFTYSLDGIFTYVSPAWTKFLGRDADEAVGKSCSSFIHPDDIDAAFGMANRIIKTGQAQEGAEYRIRHKDGSWRWLTSNTIPVKNGSNEVIGFEGTARDITGQKLAQEALKESDAKYSIYVENAPDGVFVTDEKWRSVEVNKAACLITGYSKAELLNMSLADLLAEEHHDAGFAAFKKLSETGSLKAEVIFKHRNGAKRWWSVDAVKVSETRALAFIKDITERKNQMHALEDVLVMNTRMMLSRFDAAFYNTALATINKVTGAKYSVLNIFEEDGLSFTTVALNGIGENILKISSILGFNPINKKWKHDPVKSQMITDNIVTCFSSLSDLAGHLLPRGIVKAIERLFDIHQVVIVKTSDNNVAVGDFTLFFQKDSVIQNRELAKIFANQIGMFIVRMRNEEKIKFLLAEKELILKEVHHRVKNNMNTISSLLSLEAHAVKESAAIAVLEDAGSRIRSMSLLYDKLYQSVDFKNIPVKDYLTALVDEIIGNFPNNRLITVEKDFQDFILDAKLLQLLGIIVNELLTNIMKYAFLGKERGLITVTATNLDTHVAITIQDDGNGIPDSVSFKNSTGFGLQLVEALTQQLNGAIWIERGKGTKVVLEFEK